MFEFRFEDRAALQLLGLIPIVLVLIWWTAKRTRQVLRTQISPKLASYLTRSVAPGKRRWKVILQCLALVFFVVALARPQSGESKAKAKSEGLEIMLAVDVSNRGHAAVAHRTRPA
jgi:Ca-activated chloride channel homolog